MFSQPASTSSLQFSDLELPRPCTGWPQQETSESVAEPPLSNKEEQDGRLPWTPASPDRSIASNLINLNMSAMQCQYMPATFHPARPKEEGVWEGRQVAILHFSTPPGHQATSAIAWSSVGKTTNSDDTEFGHGQPGSCSSSSSPDRGIAGPVLNRGIACAQPLFRESSPLLDLLVPKAHAWRHTDNTPDCSAATLEWVGPPAFPPILLCTAAARMA